MKPLSTRLFWNEVQALLASNRVDRVPGTTDRQPSAVSQVTEALRREGFGLLRTST